jgi:aspartyl-tRNA(Asn)/glutamyl-tRNA(Gln) amidotransferase subunit B
VQITQQLQLTSLSLFSSPGHSNPTSKTDQELNTLCQAAITALPNEVAAVRAGNKNVVNKIVGRVMRESRGRADAKGVKALVEELILGGGDKS